MQWVIDIGKINCATQFCSFFEERLLFYWIFRIFWMTVIKTSGVSEERGDITKNKLIQFSFYAAHWIMKISHFIISLNWPFIVGLFFATVNPIQIGNFFSSPYNFCASFCEIGQTGNDFHLNIQPKDFFELSPQIYWQLYYNIFLFSLKKKLQKYFSFGWLRLTLAGLVRLHLEFPR